MPKINTYTDNATIEDVDALLTYDPAGNGATKLTTFARIASWISAKLSALTKKTSIASTDQILMVDGAASPVVTKRIDYNVLAKAIIEQYASSSLAGANQSVKTALDALNSNVTFLSGGSAAVSDVNNITQTGVYKTVNSTANTPVTGYHYVIYHAVYTDTEAYQMAISATLRLYVRTMQSSTWGAWQEK